MGTKMGKVGDKEYPPFLWEPIQPNIKNIWQLMRPIKAKTENHRGPQYLFTGTHCGTVVETNGDMVNTTEKIRVM